jgi:non-homologous end joining protein Ku
MVSMLAVVRASRRWCVCRTSLSDGTIDAEILAIAHGIIDQRTGKFDPSRFRDRYQESLRELIEAKMKGLPISRERSRPLHRSSI